MTREEIATVLEVASYKIDESLWCIEPEKLLETINDGRFSPNTIHPKCPKCGSKDVAYFFEERVYECWEANQCDHVWKEK